MAKIHRLETSVAALSPARQRLKDLLDQRAACEQRIASLRAARSRLMGTLDEAVRATKALIDFDAESGAATLAWAKNALSKQAASQVDTNRRQELLTEKAITSENAAAANTAMAQLEADINAEARASQALQPEIDRTIAEVIAETCDVLFDDFVAAHRALIAKQSRINEAVATIVEIAHSGEHETMRPTFTLMQGLMEKVRVSVAPPATVTAGADHAAWASLKARLRTDPLAELES